MDYVINQDKLAFWASKFISYVKYKNKTDSDYIDFVENGFLVKEEGYKTAVFENAKAALNAKNWTPKMVGTGKILEKARFAVSKAQNLLYETNGVKMRDFLDPKSDTYKEGSEQVIYDIYKSTNDAEYEKAFNDAKKLFGGTYCRIAYLFYIKNNSCFLPIGPENFDRAFAKLEVKNPQTNRLFKTSRNCSWKNYCIFIQIISEVQKELPKYLNTPEVRLIDAHTFLGILGGDGISVWKPEKKTLAEIEGRYENWANNDVINNGNKQKTSTSKHYCHSAEVTRITKQRANGYCQLCGNKAPFIDKKGNPYLECHHIVWLSNGGDDSTDNTVALCPNCHTKMHILDDELDVKYLLNIKKEK